MRAAISFVSIIPALQWCNALVATSLSQPQHHHRHSRCQQIIKYSSNNYNYNDLHPPSLSTTALNMGSRRGTNRRRRKRRRTRHGIDADVDVVKDCPILFKDERVDHLGLAKSIDAEYAIEEAKRNLSFWEVLEREQNRPLEDISGKSRGMSAWDRTKRRMTYAKGNVESKYVLMQDRSYGEEYLLDKNHINDPPSLDDLNQSPASFKERYWSTSLFRIGVVAVAYCSFPLFLKFWYNFQTIDPDEFDIVVGQIAPNIGVLYATLLALTLQVLYGRFTRIQENSTTEAMLLSQVARNLLSLFSNENDREWAIESCQMVANQMRMMVSRTRGVELLSIMKADTYSNLLSIVDDYHYLHGCDDDYTAQEESVTNMLRQEIGQLMETRALRLSDEASSLPPTHFVLLTSLSIVSITAYVTASLKVVDDLMHPPQEASLLFAGLMALYILFFNFCRDLNGPFSGVYQIKRSNAVSHLLQCKWLIVNQLGDSVSFNVNYGDEKSSEDIAMVDANAMQTLVSELESAVETIGEDGDLCDAALPATSTLDCIDDRESRLVQLQEELGRLKLMNQQLARPNGETDPNMKLHQMEDELSRLKSLSQKLNEVKSDTSSTAIGAVAYENISLARAALEQASSDTMSVESELATVIAATEQQSTTLVESAATSLTDEATKVSFDGKLEDGLYLAGVGNRKKAFINIYAVAMYSSPSALEAVSALSNGDDAKTELHRIATSFDNSSSSTSFVLQMTFKAGAETIASAIADSVRPRYNGPAVDVKQLEALISEGVKSKGGQATKGTVFRFDCTNDRVSVSVDGNLQGTANFVGIGGAFVDVFMDGSAVSPHLIDSCLDTWCESSIYQQRKDAKNRISASQKKVNEAHTKEETAREAVNALEAKQQEESISAEHAALEHTTVEARPSDDQLLEEAETRFQEEQMRMAAEEEKRIAEEAAAQAIEEARRKSAAIETKITPLKEKATGVTFDSKLEDGLFLVGAGVRKKAIINVYAVAIYSSLSALEALSPFSRGKKKQEAQTALQSAARSFSPSSPKTSFVLEMTFKADAATIAGAIGEGVKPRYSGSAADVKELETLIINGVKSKGGQATKGTVFRFDCTEEGVSVSVDGNLQGTAKFRGMGSAFVDVFVDGKAVSPQLIDSCLDTWCGCNLF